jgi:hypothetical protein
MFLINLECEAFLYIKKNKKKKKKKKIKKKKKKNKLIYLNFIINYLFV